MTWSAPRTGPCVAEATRCPTSDWQTCLAESVRVHVVVVVGLVRLGRGVGLFAFSEVGIAGGCVAVADGFAWGLCHAGPVPGDVR